jgi:hypothetical protein
MDNELFDILSYDESIISDTLQNYKLANTRGRASHSDMRGNTRGSMRDGVRDNMSHGVASLGEARHGESTLAKTLINTLSDISSKLNKQSTPKCNKTKQRCIEGFAVKKKCSCDNGIIFDDKFILFILFLYVIYCYIQHCNMTRIHEQLFILNNTKK